MPSNTSENLRRDDPIKRKIQELESLKKTEHKLSKENEDLLQDLKLLHARELLKKSHDEELDFQKKLHDEKLKQLKEEGKVNEQIQTQLQDKIDNLKENSGAAVTNAIANITSSITQQLDSTINNYIDRVQSMRAHLIGSGSTFEGLTDNLNNALTGTGLVSQQRVFNNLAEYLKSGIVYNVEQRAFLRTIADDINLAFDGWTDSMNQLVRIQGSDSTANRLALEYSLQEFLNENYKTSEYIVKSFSSVSESLITAQSTMSAQNAMAFEGVVQSWLGSMYSSGMNASTVSSLASALNQLGSGDISNLGSGISNLVLMGAARAGLDYGALLNNGLDASTTDKLLASITSYLQEMGANQSNVVRSQLGNLFGVSITDLISAANMRNASGGVSTDINSTLLADFAGFTPWSKRFDNMLNNFMFSWGTNIASSPLAYGSYQVEKILSGVLGQALSGVSVEAGLPFLKGEINLGQVASALPLLTLLPTLIQTVGGDLIPALSSGNNSLTGIFNMLGQATQGGRIKISDIGTSGSIYVGSGQSSNLLGSAMSSLNDLTGSVMAVEADQGPTLEENVTTITETLTTMLDLLTERLESIDTNVTILSATNNLASAAATGWTTVTGFSV